MQLQLVLAFCLATTSMVASQWGRGAYGGGAFNRGARRYGYGIPGYDFPDYGPRFLPPEVARTFPEDRDDRPTGETTTTASKPDETTKKPTDEGRTANEPRDFDGREPFGRRGFPDGPQLGLPGYPGPGYGYFPRGFEPRFNPRGYGYFPRGYDGVGTQPRGTRSRPSTGNNAGTRATTTSTAGNNAGTRGTTSTGGSTATTVSAKEESEAATVGKLDARTLGGTTNDNVVSSASQIDKKIVELVPNTSFGEDGRNTFAVRE